MLSIVLRTCQPRHIPVKQCLYTIRTSSLFAPKLTIKPKSLIPLVPFRKISVTPVRMSAVDHSKLWTVERLLAVSLLASLPAAIAYPTAVLDNIAAISIVMHQYWGLEAIVNDYIRAIIFGNVIPKLTHVALIALTLATLGGLFYFNYNNVGIGKAIRSLWTIQGGKPVNAEELPAAAETPESETTADLAPKPEN